MVSITMPIDENLRAELKRFSWVNWSEISKEEAMKKLIFEKFMKTRKVSDKDNEFCEKVDWHPVDELPLKPSYIKKLQKIRKEKGIRFNSVDELFKKIK
ncbi:MAG: hypothetical protein KAQ83_02295 [Nanoarchaeota archaeon]|nr:hypothetical protein [Nanoarchaeota archaeon]